MPESSKPAHAAVINIVLTPLDGKPLSDRGVLRSTLKTCIEAACEAAARGLRLEWVDQGTPASPWYHVPPEGQLPGHLQADAFLMRIDPDESEGPSDPVAPAGNPEAKR